MDTLEEEKMEMMMVINPNQGIPEAEEEDDDAENSFQPLSRAISTDALSDVMSEAEEEEMRARMRKLQASRAGSRRPSVVDCTTKAGTTGRWSRRNSLAGNEFLKIEDEVRSTVRNISSCLSTLTLRAKKEGRVLRIYRIIPFKFSPFPPTLHFIWTHFV